MWTRSELKDRGKQALHRNYWITVLATLIVAFLTGELANSSGSSARSGADGIGSVKGLFDMIPLMWFIAAGIGIVAAAVLYSVFIGNIIEVGGCRFFEENSEHKAKLGLIMDGFSGGSYLNKAGTLFFRDLYIFLWTLCLVIPGIIKSYEYKMIPYILAENPEITRERAFEISQKMMAGQKGDAFVLDLSFIGWDILGAITFGIVSILYVSPYKNTTWAEFYKVRRESAIEEGIVTREELTGLRKEVDE